LHYYSFNIGDYASHSSRLSPIEDLAYRRMLDLYYLNERPFNECSTTVARDIGLSEYLAEVDYILTKYFQLVGGFWVQKRCNKEIAVYQNKRKAASRAGKASGKARKHKASEQTFNDRSTTVQPTNNQEPITNNHIKNKTVRFAPPSIAEVAEYCNAKEYQNVDPERFFNFYEANGWMVGKNKMKKWKAAVANWEKSNGQNQAGKGRHSTTSTRDITLEQQLNDRSWAQ